MRYDLKYGSIPDVVRVSAREYGRDIAIDDVDDVWSYQDLEVKMLDFARSMIALGVDPGDRVAICAPNSAQWIQAAVGLMAAGAILVPLNTRFKEVEIEYVLRKSGAKAVIVAGEFLGTDYVELVHAAAAGLPSEPRIVSMGDRPEQWVASWTDFLAAGRAVPVEEVHQRISALTATSYSDILFTSGTTGAPKGVQLKHSQAIRAYGWLGEMYDFRRGDVFPIVPPFFHAFGYKSGWLASLIHGVCVVPMRTFDARQLLGIIEEKGATILVGPPTLFIDLANEATLAEFDISSLRVSVPSSAKVSPKVFEDMREVLGFTYVLRAYGLTEASAMVSTARKTDAIEEIADSAGRPALDVEVIIVDDDGEPVSQGLEGEIFVRGYNVFDGYWEDEAATEEAFAPGGYLRTGDIGRFDERGFLHITDRKKDMFIVGGFNAYPAEIEDLLGRFDKVLHSAVIGIPDDRMGEVGCAFVVAKPGVHLTPEEVVSYAREHMANFKVPRRVLIVDELPRNASMKVVKPELRQRLSGGS